MNTKSWLLSGIVVVSLVLSSIATAAESTGFKVIYQNSTEAPVSDPARQLFKDALTTEDFWASLRYFITQKELSYCAIASSVVVLNSLDISAPANPNLYPYQLFDQDNIFTDKVLKIISPTIVGYQSTTLEEMNQLISTYPVNVERVYASNSSVDKFRRAAIVALKSPNQRLLVNFDRKGLQQEGGGHVSPVVAYHEAQDRFLVLDVARYKLPSYWVESAHLFQAMSGIDDRSKRSRGYVIVSKRMTFKNDD
ncbi:phytochelatin synthase family protein [Shewanella surugensis]|uniref:glutathione gamma-glutamylcysteinyltransferase n=1 Tax=Shewanella surugensis TaxID=212020 RepID=A0ABT0LIK5_9GAMM|nr:phytochelatin synthase family protein [Shewanella surugensis]MCL1127534.1 phytochelatin synthase family protein [Shewanella surugensis]